MTANLDALRAYARDPLPEPPPEILPWDSGDPWAIDGAARQALGLLLDGEGPGERLYVMADYLLTFITAADRRWTEFPDSNLLNATALALIGIRCAGQHPEADLWRLVGAARLATQAHERKAALEDRALAACLLAVFEAADASGLPVLADLLTLRERMWGVFVDHSRAERLQVSAADYPAHMREPVPPEALGGLVRARAWQAARSPEYLLDGDIQEADEICRNFFTLRAHMLVRHQFGDEVDWSLRLFDDKESTVSLNFHGHMRVLAAAYQRTGDEKYARHAARLLWSFYRACPLPNHKQYLGPWRTLEVGNRQMRAWVDITGWLGGSAAFDDDLHAMMARSRLDHIRYALAYCGGPNNWYQVEASGLAVAALFSPELALSEAYLRIALRRLKWINSFAYYDDGFQFELTHGYHMFPTGALFSVVRTARARGVALPEDFTTLVEKAHEMYLYSLQPDHQLPKFNDCNPEPMDPALTLRAAAETFGREDFAWGGTYGKQGCPPDHGSHAWPSAGLYAMRSGWDDKAQFLFFDGAPWGASHQHEDKLTFTLYSHGRLLIGDPNIYSYSDTELTHYFKSSRGHNLVMVDGMGQARRFDPRAKFVTEGRSEWVSQPEFDFVSSEYLEGYAPDPYPVPRSLPEIDRSVGQRRAIFYVKPGYWILCDRMTGEGGRERSFEQIFHLAPVEHPGEPAPLQAGEVAVTPEWAVTRNPGLGNLAILPVDSDGLEARAQKGETSPAAGWYGVLGEYPAWDVTFQRRSALPLCMDAVLYPLAPGQAETPSVRRLLATDSVTAFTIRGAGVDDLFVLCEEGSGPVTIEGVTFEGRALLLRRREKNALTVGLVSLTGL